MRAFSPLIFCLSVAILIASSSASNCSNFQGRDACVGNQTEYTRAPPLERKRVTARSRYPPAIDSRRWQTPPRGSAGWTPQYQDQSCLVGHARVVYSADHLSAIVTVISLTSDPSAAVLCSFDGSDFGLCSLSFSTKFTSSLRIQA